MFIWRVTSRQRRRDARSGEKERRCIAMFRRAPPPPRDSVYGCRSEGGLVGQALGPAGNIAIRTSSRFSGKKLTPVVIGQKKRKKKKKKKRKKKKKKKKKRKRRGSENTLQELPEALLLRWSIKGRLKRTAFFRNYRSLYLRYTSRPVAAQRNNQILNMPLDMRLGDIWGKYKID